MSVDEFILEAKDRHNYLSLKRDTETGDIYVVEARMDPACMLKPEVRKYKCNGFEHGEYDLYLIQGIKKVLRDKPCTIQLSRWYPERDPNTFVSSGNYALATRIKYSEHTMVMNFTVYTDMQGIDTITTYQLHGEKHIQKLLKFLEM